MKPLSQISKLLLAIPLLGISMLSLAHAQRPQRPFSEMMADSAVDFQATKAAFNSFWEGKTPQKGEGYSVFKRWEYINSLRQDPQGNIPAQGYEAAEMTRWRKDEATQRRSNLAPTGNWTAMGPQLLPTNNTSQPHGVARTTTIEFHPTDPNKLYVGTPAGGLWISTNNGATWAGKTDFLPTLGVSSILVDPSNPNIIYIGTGDKDASDASGLGVYKSLDGGDSWTVSNSGMGDRTVASMVFDPNDNTKIIAATSGGFYRSTNSGSTWTQVLSGSSPQQVIYRPASNSVLYALDRTDLYTSTDDGATWNSGVTFGSYRRAAMAVTPANAMHVYIVKDESSNNVYRSTDGGTTVNNVQTDGKNLLHSDCTGATSGGQGFYDICIAADPLNANNITVGGVSLFKSTNGGASFAVSGCWNNNVTNIHADHHSAFYTPHNSARLYICNDGGLYYTDDFGVSYTNISSGIVASQIYRIGVSGNNPKTLIGGFQDNGVIVSRQPNWWVTSGGDGLDCAIDALDDNYQYGTYIQGLIRRSTNGGFNWSVIAQNGTGGINETGAWLTPYKLQPGNGNVMLAGYVSIWRSTNVKGASPTFTKVLPLSSGNVVDIEFATANTVYASTDDYSFYQSLDGGLSWTQKTNTPSGYAKDIATDPSNPQNVWVASWNEIHKSTDGGSTWTLYDTGLPNVSALTITYDHVGQALYCGMWTGVYYRHISDPSWTSFNAGLPNSQAFHLQIFYDQTGCVGRDKLILGTYGRGVWQSDLRSSPTLPPVACFGGDTTRVCFGNGVLQLRDSSAYDPTSWTWSITGPGTATYVNSTSANSQNPEVSFSAAGLYTVELTATNTNGSDIKTRTDYIEAVLAPVGFTSADSLIYAGQTVTFTNQSSDCATSWLWDFGDGMTSTLKDPSHVYATGGSYTVTLTINGGVNTISKPDFVQVLPHLALPYTANTAGWAGDMEAAGTAFHFGDKKISGSSNIFERGAVTMTFPAAASGTNCWATGLSSNVPFASDYGCAVMTPTFDFSGAGKYRIGFKMAMETAYCNGPSGAAVEYTTNQGVSWTRLGGAQGTDPNAVYNWHNRGGTGGCDEAVAVPGLIGWSTDELTFKPAIYDATSLAGNAKVGFRIAFYTSSAYGAFAAKGFAFDDFEVDYLPATAEPDPTPGSMITFDGVDDYIETYYPANPAIFSVEAWVMAPASPSATHHSTVLKKDDVFELSWSHSYAPARGGVSLRNSGGSWQDYTFGSLSGNTWYHLAMTFNGTTVNTYKNGELITSAPFSGTLTSNANTWRLGIGSGPFFAGSVDEFRMWSVVRTTQEIRESMHRTLDLVDLPNVLINYQANEASGNFKDNANLRTGYLQNGVGRSLSPVAVGKGVSQTISITAPGVYNFGTPQADIAFTSASGTPFDVTVTRINQFVNEQTPNPMWNALPNTTLLDKNTYFYHVINKYGGAAFSADVTVNGLSDVSATEAATPALLKLVKRSSNSVSAWDLGISANAATVSAGFTGTATFPGITNFSQAFVGSEETAIFSISDVSIFAMPNTDGNAIAVSWLMNDANAYQSWKLFKSASQAGFENGNSTELFSSGAGNHTFSFLDEDVAEGQDVFYRLELKDLNGGVTSSNIVMARLDGSEDLVRIVPNPNAGTFFLDFVGTGSIATVTLTDLEGKTVYSEQLSTSKMLLHHPIQVATLAKGMYFLTLQIDGKKETEKVLLMK